jgi:hypothetical protein
MARFTVVFKNRHTERKDDIKWVGSPERPMLAAIVPHTHQVELINGDGIERVYAEQGLLEEGGATLGKEE